MSFLTSRLTNTLPEKDASNSLADLLRFVGFHYLILKPAVCGGKLPSQWALSRKYSATLESAATTAAIERAFSTAKWVDSRLRNGLSVGNIKMLVFCNRRCVTNSQGKTLVSWT